MVKNLKSDEVTQFRTICEVHREIYDLVHEHIDQLDTFKQFETKLEECYQMAKKMDLKLRQYKNNYDEAWWEEHSSQLRAQKHLLRLERNHKKK